MRWRFIPETKEWIQVDKRLYEPLAPVYQSDEMPPTEHPASPTGEKFTSRKAYDAYTLAQGYQPAGGCDGYKNTSRTRSVNYEARDGALREAIEKHYYDLRDSRIPKPEPRQYSEHTRELLRRTENTIVNRDD